MPQSLTVLALNGSNVISLFKSWSGLSNDLQRNGIRRTHSNTGVNVFNRTNDVSFSGTSRSNRGASCKDGVVPLKHNHGLSQTQGFPRPTVLPSHVA